MEDEIVYSTPVPEEHDDIEPRELLVAVLIDLNKRVEVLEHELASMPTRRH